MMPRGRPAIALVVSLALVAAACSGGDQPELVIDDATPAAAATTEAVTGQATPTPVATPTSTPATPTPTPGDESTPTPVATPTPLPPPTPSPTPTATPEPPESVAAQPCAEGLAGSPVESSTATADVDGDGAQDQVTVYGTGSASNPAPWRVRVDTAAGEAIDSPLAVDPGVDAVPIGGADVDGDGAGHEVFIAVGAGASTVIVAIYTLVGCELVQTTNGGAPIGFPIGGGVQNLGGLECVDTDGDGVTDAVVAWLAIAVANTGDGTYAIEGVEYELRGAELRETGTRRLRANVSEADFVYGSLGCGSVSL